MLTHIVPKFEKGRILKTEMLENLRDYPVAFWISGIRIIRMVLLPE